MNVRRNIRPRLVLGATLVIACLCALVSGVAAVNLATGSLQIGSVGETVSVPIVLDSASDGISGYRITASLSNPSVATITAVEFPAWASLKSASTLPSAQVVLQGVDLSQQVPLGGANVVLATLTVKGTATGSTGIVITPDTSMGIQNRNGDLYPVTVQPGTLTVGTPSPGVPTQIPTSAVSTPVTTIVAPTTIPTVIVPPPITTVVSPPSIPTSGGSTNPVVPVTTSVPGSVSPGGSTDIVSPTVITPGAQPTFGVGKRYAIGNPGSFIGTRFGSGGATDDTTDRRTVTGPEATLKPGSRAYGITPPAGKFVRWYPEARWKAGIT